MATRWIPFAQFVKKIAQKIKDFATALSSMTVVKLVPYATKFLQTVFTVISVLPLVSKDYPPQAQLQDGDTFDFIIVGAGSAGCVLANRLTEIASTDRLTYNVLLIEAGGPPVVDLGLPGLFPFVDYSFQDWNYFNEDDGYIAQAHKTKTIHYTRGRMLGGSSGANYMFFVRGHPQDFDAWAEKNGKFWSWESVRKSFVKMERVVDEKILANDFQYSRGTNGYVGVTRPEWEINNEYFEAFHENGHALTLDYNDGFRMLGYSTPQFSIADGRRQSTAYAYLRPIKQRNNLYVRTNTYVTKVNFDNNLQATGVTAKLENGKYINVRARFEVILSAGCFNSPKLLMLSGIGPKKHLQKMGIEVKVNSKHVGNNFQDHPTLMISLVKRGYTNFKPIKEGIKALSNLNRFPNAAFMGHVTLDKSKEYPDYQIMAFPLIAGTIIPTLICTHVFRYLDNICFELAKAGHRHDSLFAILSLMHPKSKTGVIKLRSGDPEDPPLIFLNYFSDNSDLTLYAQSIQDYISVLNTTYFKNAGGDVIDLKIPQCANIGFGTHQYWKCYALNMVNTQWHGTGTCRMGPKGEGVVDHLLKVRGVKSLRVVDASIMPEVTSGNINAPTIMIAEHIATDIRESNIEKLRRINNIKSITKLHHEIKSQSNDDNTFIFGNKRFRYF